VFFLLILLYVLRVFQKEITTVRNKCSQSIVTYYSI
jgi:hypothetical protein